MTSAAAMRYQQAGKRGKSRILDELSANAGWHRSHARQALATTPFHRAVDHLSVAVDCVVALRRTYSLINPAVPRGVDPQVSQTSRDLFNPFTVGSLTIPNRFAMAPMTRAASPGGVPGSDVAAYYARRAAGGVGLIITEGVRLADPAAGWPFSIPTLCR